MNLAALRGKLRDWLHLLLPGAILAGALALRVADSPWVTWIQNQAFDAYLRAAPRAYAPVPVRVVDIDEESLRRVGQWPWPRTTLARLVRRLNEAGASAVAFDAVFAEPDRTSPASVIASWPADPSLRDVKSRIAALPDHDAAFARSMAGGRVVLGFAMGGDAASPLPERPANFGVSGDPPTLFLPEFEGTVRNLAPLEKAAAGVGCIGFVPDSDGILRRAPLLFNARGRVYPSLALEALRVAQGAKTIAVKSSGGSGARAFGGQHTGIVMVKVGAFKIPTDGEGRFSLHFTRKEPGRTVPAWKALDGSAEPGAFRGAIVFVGTSAQGLRDLRPTPLDSSAPGVEAHAQVAEQVLLGDFLSRPDWATGAEICFLVALGLLLIVLMRRLGPTWCAVLGLAAIAGSIVLSWRSFTYRGWLFDAVYPSLSVLAIYLASSLITYLKTEAERRQVRSAFGQYLHPKLVADLARHPEKLQLGGVVRDMTVLFCDIRGFTTISEQYDAIGLTRVINRFLTPMSGVIMERMGTIDKYIGDCIMACWNAPEDDPAHAANACASALEMHRRLGELNVRWEAEDVAAGRKFIAIHIGAGLNSGPCLVGNMGSDQKFNYSVLGDDVNLASRLEGQSKTYGVDTVIGPRTRESAPAFAALELDLIKVKGKTKPVRIHALLGDAALAADADFRRLAEEHAAMLAAYRAQGWDEALRRLAACENLGGSLRLTKLYRLYEQRVEAYRAAPPGESWDGAYTALTK